MHMPTLQVSSINTPPTHNLLKAPSSFILPSTSVLVFIHLLYQFTVKP